MEFGRKAGMGHLSYLSTGDPHREWRKQLFPAALVVGALLVTFAVTTVIPEAQFWAKMDGANVVGKSTSKVTLLLGRPDDQLTMWNGDQIWIYGGPHGIRFRIDFRAGIAVTALHTARP